MIDSKIEKKIYNLCTKIGYVFSEFYILKQGYILSQDIEKPFLIQLDEESVNWFSELVKDFKIIHITDVRNFKKDMTTNIVNVTSKSEISRVIKILETYKSFLNICEKWDKFLLSNNEEENEKLILSLFKNNNYIEFHPSNEEHPNIILAKSLLPLVSEKNYTDLYYTTKEITKSLYLLIFDFQFDLFRLYMFHHYVPMDNIDEAEE